MANIDLRCSALLSGLALSFACAGFLGCSNDGAASSAFNTGLKHFNDGDNEKAIERFSEAIRLKPDDEVAFYNRGLAYQETNQTEKAIADHSEAIRLNPTFSLAYFERGNAHAAQRHGKEAKADYKKAKELNPDLDVPIPDSIGGFVVGEEDDFARVPDAQKKSLMAIVKAVPTVNYAYDESKGQKTVRTLLLDRGAFGNELIAHIASLPDLKVLTFVSDQVTDAGLPPLAKLSALERLAPISQQITAEGLKPLQGLPALKFLSLRSKKIDNSALAEFKKFSKLESLSLNDASFDDNGLGMLTDGSQLKELHIERTAITDAGLKHFVKMPKLERLYLGFTKISDDGFKQLQASMPSLKVVRTDQEKEEKSFFRQAKP